MPSGTDDEAEWRTRRERIDPRLKACGWEIVRFDASRPLSAYKRHAITEYETANGPADYALCVDGRILGIVEAKRVGLNPQERLPQAERYSKGIKDSPFKCDGGHGAPFLYATNGELCWFHDVRHAASRSRPIGGFHTPEALREILAADFDAACQRLQALPNAHKLIRPYQVEANASTEKAIAERKRQMLLAMATGTGKTFTMVNQIYRLMKTGVAKRILFLVDRRALAAQAVRAFASFEAEPSQKFDQIYEVYSQRFRREDFEESEKFDPKVLPSSYLLTPKTGHAFVYVSTIQRMAINLFGKEAVFSAGDESPDEDAEKLDIPIHAFDLIVADECHRGYTSQELSVWRNTLDHFDAIKIGLTATPAAHTTAYFKEVVFRYEYERAVREGHLVDYDVVAIKSDVRMNGIFLEEGEQVGVVDTRTGQLKMDFLEDERQVDASEVERKATAPDSNRKILEEVKKYALAHQEKYGRFPKTLIFAVNDIPHTSHCDQLADIARDVFGQGDAFVQKITGTVDRPLQRIREFRNRPQPSIVVTVDMLSTGVDIPDLEYIVFLRPVKSRILFEQMLGRGTRKGEKFPDKSHFTVFDCFDGTLLAYFQKATAITADPPEKPSRTIQEVIEAIWKNQDRDYNVRCLAKRLQRIDKETTPEGREQFARFIPDGNLAAFAKDLTKKLKDDFADTMKLLRDPDLQKLLTDYPRPKETFYVAHGAQDEVSSRHLVRDPHGNEYKPEDYLAAFARFVKENASQIQAIGILLGRPQDWSTEALLDLRDKLKKSRQGFSEETLQRVYEQRYSKALVDLISMVKHAAREEEPLLTAEERVARAFDRLTAGQKFTPEQTQWLGCIRSHLVQNLSISREDFEAIPVLSNAGGWGPANRAFGGKLPDWLKRFNKEIAA